MMTGNNQHGSHGSPNDTSSGLWTLPLCLLGGKTLLYLEGDPPATLL